MSKCLHNKNASSIRTNLADLGVEEEVSSIEAATLLVQLSLLIKRGQMKIDIMKTLAVANQH